MVAIVIVYVLSLGPDADVNVYYNDKAKICKHVFTRSHLSG